MLPTMPRPASRASASVGGLRFVPPARRLAIGQELRQHRVIRACGRPVPSHRAPSRGRPASARIHRPLEHLVAGAFCREAQALGVQQMSFVEHHGILEKRRRARTACSRAAPRRLTVSSARGRGKSRDGKFPFEIERIAFHCGRSADLDESISTSAPAAKRPEARQLRGRDHRLQNLKTAEADDADARSRLRRRAHRVAVHDRHLPYASTSMTALSTPCRATLRALGGGNRALRGRRARAQTRRRSRILRSPELRGWPLEGRAAGKNKTRIHGGRFKGSDLDRRVGNNAMAVMGLATEAMVCILIIAHYPT